jgi:hypothetical protein
MKVYNCPIQAVLSTFGAKKYPEFINCLELPLLGIIQIKVYEKILEHEITDVSFCLTHGVKLWLH